MLVSIPGIAAFFCFTVVAAVLHADAVAGFCLFILLVCGVSRLWGELAIHKLSVSVSAHSTRMFAGDSTDVSFSIRNGKPLPLIWFELLLPMPRRNCVMPELGFSEAPVTLREEESWNEKTALKGRFAFLMGNDTFEWRVKWSALRRGVYCLDRLVLRSGDGFGLTQSQTVTAPESVPVFIVYPEIKDVDITPFLQLQWDGTGGERGFMDDLTVMRGLRRYENGDAWKHINWRMAARGQEISVNIYETVTPKAIHFIFDTESFCTENGDDTEYEDAVSSLASLLLRLSDAGVMCGLSLPRSKHMPQTDIPASGLDVSEQLAALSGCDMLLEKDEERSAAENRAVFLQSEFDWSAVARASRASGRIYYVARDAGPLCSRGIPDDLNSSNLALLSYNEAYDADAEALGIRALRLPGKSTASRR